MEAMVVLGQGGSRGGGEEGWDLEAALKAILTPFPYGMVVRCETEGGGKGGSKGWQPHLEPSHISRNSATYVLDPCALERGPCPGPTS